LPKKNFGILKNEFHNIDVNSTGSVTTDEFRRCLSVGEMKATPNLVDFLVNELDNT
jgi:Ca2+-binding EF-hand superfamily protein